MSRSATLYVQLTESGTGKVLSLTQVPAPLSVAVGHIVSSESSQVSAQDMQNPDFMNGVGPFNAGQVTLYMVTKVHHFLNEVSFPNGTTMQTYIQNLFVRKLAGPQPSATVGKDDNQNQEVKLQ